MQRLNCRLAAVVPSRSTRAIVVAMGLLWGSLAGYSPPSLADTSDAGAYTKLISYMGSASANSGERTTTITGWRNKKAFGLTVARTGYRLVYEDADDRKVCISSAIGGNDVAIDSIARATDVNASEFLRQGAIAWILSGDYARVHYADLGPADTNPRFRIVRFTPNFAYPVEFWVVAETGELVLAAIDTGAKKILGYPRGSEMRRGSRVITSWQFPGEAFQLASLDASGFTLSKVSCGRLP